MRRPWATRLTLMIVSLAFAASAAQAQLGATVRNWPVPSSSGSSGRGIRALADVTNPVSFIGVTPCRIVDTRGPVGTFGGPSLPASGTRNFPLPTGPCAGIPASASAYSLNITVTNTLGPGFIKIYPQGGAAPVVSTLNYLAGQTLANAAIVPAGTSGGVTVVAGVSGTDLIIDINGYYGPSPATTTDPFVVTNAAGTGSAAIIGNNFSSADDASGVIGRITLTSPGFGSAGVRGINSGQSFNGVGVYGTHGGGGYGVFGQAPSGIGVYGNSTSGIGVAGDSGSTTGVQGQAYGSAAGTAAVYGLAVSTTGRVYGVFGQSSSTSFEAAGVRGLDATGSPVTLPSFFLTAGVIGDSKTGAGVLGRARFAAVDGELYNSGGAFIAAGILGTTFGTAGDATTGPWGVFSSGNFGATGVKHFVEPHPGDPKKVILYSSIEGRTVDTYFRGTATAVNHEATIEVPEDFRIVTDEDGLTVQLTPVGGFAQMYVQSQDLHRIVVRSSRDIAFHYLIQGVRRAFKNFQPVQTGYEFMPVSAEARMPLHLTAEAQQRLIANGTYHPDGTVNMQTAERAGFVKIWTDRAAATKAAAQKTREPIRVNQSE